MSSRESGDSTPRTGDRMDERVREVCQAIGAFIEAWGFRSIHGRVWALLAIRSAPLSQTEIADFLGVSRSLIHLAVQELEDYGLVRPVDDRRSAPYEARLDVWPTITDVLRSREWMLIERARSAIDAAIEEATFCRERGIRTPFDAERLRLLLHMTELAQGTLRALIAVRMPRTLGDLRGWLRTAARRVRKLQALVAMPARGRPT